MKWTMHLVRDGEAWDNVELFLVSAVVSVLLIRSYLEVTGYPTIGGEGLHIAHMLWGGLLLLAAAMIIYTLFILLFLAARALIGNRPMSADEERINRNMKRFFPERSRSLGSKVGLYFTLKERLAVIYRTIALNRWFKRVLTAGFIVVGVIGLVSVAGTIARRPGIDPEVSLVQMAASTASLACIFYHSQFAAIGGLAEYLLLYFALHFVIARERETAAGTASWERGSLDPSRSLTPPRSSRAAWWRCCR